MRTISKFLENFALRNAWSSARFENKYTFALSYTAEGIEVTTAGRRQLSTPAMAEATGGSQPHCSAWLSERQTVAAELEAKHTGFDHSYLRCVITDSVILFTINEWNRVSEEFAQLKSELV